MTIIKRTILYAAIVGLMLAVGCNQANIMGKNRDEARQRWAASRAEIATKLAQGCYMRGELDRAHQHVDELVRLNVPYAPLYVLAARLAAEQGDFDVACAHAESAKMLDPKDPEACYVLGTIEQTLGHPDRALEEFTLAATLEPGQARYVLAQAEMLVSRGSPEEALEALQDASERLGGRAEFHAARGDVLAVLKRYGEAAGSYRIGLRLAPDQVEVKERLARALFYGGDYSEAESALAELASPEQGRGAGHDRPDAPAGWISRMRLSCLLALGRTADARTLLAVAGEAETSDTVSLIGLAKCDILDDRLPSARKHLDQVLAKSPRDAEANALMGYCLMAGGRPGEAVPHLEFALKDPKLSDRAAIERLLEQARSELARPAGGSGAAAHTVTEM